MVRGPSRTQGIRTTCTTLESFYATVPFAYRTNLRIAAYQTLAPASECCKCYHRRVLGYGLNRQIRTTCFGTRCFHYHMTLLYVLAVVS